MDEQIDERKEQFLKQIKIQENFVYYLQYLLEKTQKNRRKDRVYENKKTGRKYFIMPTLLERFFDIEFTKYIMLKDKYFLEYGDESIERYLNYKREVTIPTIQTSYRMSNHIKKYYEYLFVLMYYFKTKYNVKITDRFLYLVYIAIDVPPAVLAYIQLHTKIRFRYYGKIENWDELFKSYPQLKEAIEKVENLYLRGLKSDKQNSVG